MTGFDLPLMLRLVRSGCYVGVPLGQRMLVGKDGFLVIPYPTQGLWMLFMAWWTKLRYTKILIKKKRGYTNADAYGSSPTRSSVKITSFF